jgi:hypothetical protein
MTNWRDYGSPSSTRWRSIVEQAGGPPELAGSVAWAMAHPHGWLALAMLHVESKYGTAFKRNKAANKNPLNLRPPGGDGYMAYPSWVDGVDAWRERITSPDYKGGIYAQTVSLEDLIHVYAPGSDDNDEAAYAATIRTLFLTWGVTPKETPMATPVIYDLAVDYARFGLTKAEANEIQSHRFTNRRDGSIQGRPTHRLCHIQAGRTIGSLKYWVGVQASSTVMIQRDGSILRVIPEEHGPWTNGDDYAPKPAGQALVDQPGNSNIWTLSIEAEGEDGADVLDYPAQMASIEWQLREWARKYPETAPMDHLLEHADVQRIQKPNCAGAYYPVIRQRLTAAPPKPLYTPPVGWPSKKGDTGIVQVGEAKARLITCEVECIKPNGTIPRAYASAKAGQSGPKIELGAKRTVIATVTVPAGQRTAQWHVLDNYDRVGANGFLPKLPQA